MACSINRRERKKMNAKNAILEAAVKLFVQKGYKETAIADIMNEADMGIGTFYNYFQSKEEILKYFLAEIISETHQHFIDLIKAPKSAAEILTETFLYTGRILDENRFVVPLFLSMANRRAASKELTHPANGPTFKDIFSGLIKRGQEQGEFRQDIPAEVVTEMFHSILQAASFSSLEMGFMQNIEYKLQLLLDGLIVTKK